MRALDVGSYENRNQQQHKQSGIYDISIILIHTHVDKQYHQTETERQSYPTELLARKLGEAQHIGVVKVIAGGIYAHHAESHKDKIEYHRKPVDIFEHRSCCLLLLHCLY